MPTPNTLLVTFTIVVSNSASGDRLYFSNYFDSRISALQNELFSYRSLSVVNFISNLVSMC